MSINSIRSGGSIVSGNQDRKVLVVEDEPDMRIFLSNLLETDGFSSTCVQNRQQGMAAASRVFPSVIIIDAMLPEEEGIRMYRDLKKNRDLKHIPVVMLSTFDKKTFLHYRKYQASGLGIGVPEPDAFLAKPPEAEELLKTVRKLSQQKPG